MSNVARSEDFFAKPYYVTINDYYYIKYEDLLQLLLRQVP